MINRIASDESLQVLLLICLPLSALLVILLVLLVKRSRRTSISATFSVTVSRLVQEQARVSYRDQSRHLELNASIKRGKTFFTPEIHVEMPQDMLGPDLKEVVPNLESGLADLHYQYLIYRMSDPARIEILAQNQDKA
jgi:hypothetical protein